MRRVSIGIVALTAQPLTVNQVEEDVRKSAIAIASTVYHLAMRDELLPRFAPDQMPRRPGGQQPPAPAQTTN